MMTFISKQRQVQALQWDGLNGETILTNFGSHISSYADAGLGDGSLTVNTTEGRSYNLQIGGWIFLDVLNELMVVKQEAMYKSYDYVSG